MTRPSLSLLCKIEKLDGSDSQTFSPASRDPQNIPTEIEIATKWGTGFEDLSFSLRRNLRQPAPDGLLRNVKAIGAGGWIAGEGRYSGAPRDERGVKVSAPGWWQAMKDLPFEEIYKDQDVSKWGGTPLDRQAGLLAGNYSPNDGTAEEGTLLLKLAQPIWSNPGLPVTTLVYTAPAGAPIGNLTASVIRTTSSWNTADGNYAAVAGLTDDDDLSGGDTTSDFAASVGTAYAVDLDATAATRRYAFFQASYGTTNGTGDSAERALRASGVAVSGGHGLTAITASAVIRNALSRACPSLRYDDNSIDDTSFEFDQLVFETGSTVENVVSECNKVHLWVPMVYDNRTFHFHAPKSADDYDWELSTYRGDQLIPTGQQASELGPFNGVRVVFNDVANGNLETVVGPLGDAAPWDTSGDASLRDYDETNPCNAENQPIFATLRCDKPIDRAIAIALGVVYLSEHKIPPQSGQGRTQGWVKDRSGAWRPAYHVRAGDRVKYADSNQIYRVFGTRYSDSTKTLDLSYDSLPYTIDAFLERLGVALAAIGSP